MTTADEPLVDQIRRKIVECCLDHGLSHDWSSLIGVEVEEWLRKTHGCSKPYVHAPDKGKQYAEIFADFTGNNHAEVCRKHGISRSKLYRIIGDAYGNR